MNEFVSTEDFPKILLATFISKPDVKRIDAAELISKLENETQDKSVIEHVIDQIWVQYDSDKNGYLDKEEGYDFMKIVLNVHEKMIAEKINREPKSISDEEVLQAMKDCDTDHDGKITKDEMNTWVVAFLKNDENYHKEKEECLEYNHEAGVSCVWVKYT